MNRHGFNLRQWLLMLLVVTPLAGAAASIDSVETEYLALRELRDAMDVTQARGAVSTPEGILLSVLADRYAAERERLVAQLARVNDTDALSEDDARALATMQDALGVGLSEWRTAPGDETAGQGDCAYDAETLLGSTGLGDLQERLYGCFAVAAQSLAFGDETLDRLAVFARLAITGDAAQREALWRSLAPVWQAVNADNDASSPYRVMLRRAARQANGSDEVARIGTTSDELGTWLVQVLEAWRDSLTDESIEPWDFGYRFGAASRALGDRVPVAAMLRINHRFYRDLGADPARLAVQYDLAPRTGKDPVAFTTFGRRPRLSGDPGQPWVFASYSAGGLGNLAELLHETGHAVHIAAIRTRPAFADWPDSDIFTEGIADLAALDLWKPEWQQRYLGRAADAGDSARERLAPIMMDIAWSLFERRMLAQPDADPNQVWTELTSTFLHIEPHPEVSWWAVRGQLIDAPGYMLNYAAGAILAADLRARLAECGIDGARWYAAVSEALYRYGLERSSADVIREFLGRPVSPQALLDEIRALAQSADSTAMEASAAR